MPETNITAVLTPTEWRLIESSRGLPAGKLHNRTREVLEDLLFSGRNPRCEGMGVEGFPCGEPKAPCEECHEIWDLLESISERIGKATP